MPDAGHGDVLGGQVGVAQRRLLRADHGVESAADGDEPGSAARCRRGEFREQRRVRAQLREQRIRQCPGHQFGQPGAAMRGGQGDEQIDLGVTTHPLDVVTGHQSAQGVRDDRHAAVFAGRGGDGVGEQTGAVLHGQGPQRQLDRLDPLESAAAQVIAQPGEHRPVVDQPVDEQHRGGGRGGRADQQTTLQRGQAAEGVVPVGALAAPGQGTRWIQGQMGREAGGLDREPTGARRGGAQSGGEGAARPGLAGAGAATRCRRRRGCRSQPRRRQIVDGGSLSLVETAGGPAAGCAISNWVDTSLRVRHRWTHSEKRKEITDCYAVLSTSAPNGAGDACPDPVRAGRRAG